MKVNIVDIPVHGLQLNITKNGDELQAIAGEVDFIILSPVSANLSLSKTDGEILMYGNMASIIKQHCARCLKQFEHKISSKIDIVYTIEPECGKKEKELSSEEIRTNDLEGNEIDIDVVLLEQLSLDIPIRAVCKSDCKGLCPKCGADLNQEKCSCPVIEQIDQRFAKLKELKLNKK
ncbi:MAG: DUF177 domain-containing protein [Deltaproteobacteria bacterium]|nr:DUF177 domain-containing protein [Deltaproteobacteria bacterium]